MDVAEGDTAFQVTISGDEGSVNNSAFIGLARTSGTNVGVEGKAHSETGNEGLQVGTYGEALGVGSSSHIGVYGYSQADGGEVPTVLIPEVVDPVSLTSEHSG